MEVDLEPGPLRRLATMGTIAIIAMLMLYLFAAKNVTDTETPRIAALAHDVLQRNLRKDQRTTLVLLSKVTDERRHYELTLHPVERVTAQPKTVQTLLASAAELVIEELGGKRPTSVTCVAVLPDGEQRVTYDHRMQQIDEPRFAAPEPSGKPE